MKVGDQVAEGLDIHGIGTPEARKVAVGDMFDAVRLPHALMVRFPHELSGGQLQRVVIARAMVLRPKLLVCDEPVSALDVSVQAQVVNLLADLQKSFGLTYLFISHDLRIVRHICDRVAVMYLGAIVEEASRDALFDDPRHPYSRALISAVPSPSPGKRRPRIVLLGEPPDPARPPQGCRFHTRCPMATDLCRRLAPELRPLGNGRAVACHIVEKEAA
jgi:oligopeptide/dipeptide ABC transporter ATP-binding protein